ncbi:MAG: bestrophin family ion channel [Crocinitomicaceae bacterium]|nr:bestrophin family ion channel [Crocinitomicaceae bacterium]
MLIEKTIKARTLIIWTWFNIVWLLAFSGAVAALYAFELIKFEIPWLPVSVIATAVAFYVGFKNSQAYDRMWEARKIWGGIVNDSRSWGMMVDGYVSNQFAEDKLSDEELQQIKTRLMYRHVAWLYAHRSQLLIPTSWEHVSQGKRTGKVAKYYQDTFGIGLVADEATKVNLESFLPKDEHERLINFKNTATQIINEQSRDIQELRERGLIDDFRHVEMVKVLRGFYALQGKNERIKKFPLPRQYANMSRIFVFILVALLPFSMMPALQAMGEWAFWLSIPVTALVGWIYVMMESIGDYTENPFQGMANDIPMLSLCRIIEIDLREMLGETDLPPNVEAKKGILM